MITHVVSFFLSLRYELLIVCVLTVVCVLVSFSREGPVMLTIFTPAAVFFFFSACAKCIRKHGLLTTFYTNYLTN